MPCISAEAVSKGIDDRAGIYTAEELAELEKRQQEVADLTGWNIAVITTDTGFGLDGIAACDYAEKYYDETFGADSSSVVYLIDLDYRWIAIDGGLLDYFDSSRFNDMMDTCENYYMNYEDVKNLEAFYYHLEKAYKNGTVERDPEIGALGDDFEEAIEYYDDPQRSISGEMILASVITGLIISGIIIAVTAARYKTHYAHPVNGYIEPGSVDMYIKDDYFLKKTVSQYTSSSSGGSSGRRSSGGSRRSGGRSHGGGGRGGRR